MFFRTRKSDSPSRFREGPVTRLCGSISEKNEKPKVEPDEADDDSLRESEKPDNNDNSENEDVSKLVQCCYMKLYIVLVLVVIHKFIYICIYIFFHTCIIFY